MSGTPPRNLLYSDPVSYDRSNPYAQIFEVNRDGPEVKAFHWGSLTSGNRITAFWILLSPFMLANVAGWMAATRPTVQSFIRLAGLGLSGLFVAQGAVVMIDLTSQVVADQIYDAWAVTGGALLLAVLFLTIVWKLSARSLLSHVTPLQQLKLLFGIGQRSLEPPEMIDSERALQKEDPAGGAKLSDDGMWVRQSVLHRLRRQHLSFGLLIIAIAIELGLSSSPLSVVALVLLSLVVLDVFLVAFPGALSSFTRGVSSLNVYLSAALLVAAIVDIHVADLPTTGWAHSHRLVFFVALGAGVAALLGLIAQLTATPPRRLAAFLPMSALAVASLIGGALGVAAAVMAELGVSRFAGELNPWQSLEDFDIARTQVMLNGGAWTTVAMFCFVMGLLALAGFAMWSDKPALPKNKGRFWALLRRATRRGPYVFGGAGVGAAALATAAGGIACFSSGPCDPGNLKISSQAETLAWVAGITGAAMILGVAGAVSRISIAGGAVVAGLGGFAGWAIWYPGFDEEVWTVPVLELPIHPTHLLDVSFVLIVLGLTYFILRSILGGFGDPEKRRKVGMLWDTGSFWPRWFHPLAPPAYSPHAVASLSGALESENPEVLAAHSQGSVIAAVTLGQKDGPLPKGFVTYGSPLGILYTKLFPDVGVEELLESVNNRWADGDKHWVNLWRNTDPLGGEPLPSMNGNRLVCGGVGHSTYELTEEFPAARSEAVGGVNESISERDTDTSIDPCKDQ